MHCNSERRVQDCLCRLGGDPACLNTLRGFLPVNLSEGESGQFLSGFLDLASLDPYRPYPRQAGEGLHPPKGIGKDIWIECLIETCRKHDREFTIALEESLRVRFQKASNLLWNEPSIM